MNDIKLSEGALAAIMTGKKVENPILQILGHKNLANSNKHFWLYLSDGLTTSPTLLATELNHRLEKNLTLNTICVIKRYSMGFMNNAGRSKRVMTILNIDVEVPGHEVGQKIGNPRELESLRDAGPFGASAGASAVPEGSPASFRSSMFIEKKRLADMIFPGSNIRITPISFVTPYQSRWVIKARVSHKSMVKTWSNARGKGYFFVMYLVDGSGEIKCTAYRGECDKFFDMIKIGNVYYISHCCVKTATTQYESTKHEYEIITTTDTEIVVCHDDAHDIPAIAFNFRSLSEVENAKKDELMDILAIVKSLDDIKSLAAGTDRRKRDVHLVDMSNVQVTLVLWGNQVDEFNYKDNSVVIIKDGSIRQFNNAHTLLAVAPARIQLDPNIPEAHRLRDWWNTSGKGQQYELLPRARMNASIITIVEALKRSWKLTDSIEHYTIKAYIGVILKDTAVYKSCPAERCHKKLIESRGTYRCVTCNSNFSNFEYRWLIKINISDWTGYHWATAFHDVSEKLLGVTAQKAGELKEMNLDRYDKIFSRVELKANFFKIRAKKEIYNGQTRVHWIITHIAAENTLDHKTYHSHLMQELKTMAKIS